MYYNFRSSNDVVIKSGEELVFMNTSHLMTLKSSYLLAD